MADNFLEKHYEEYEAKRQHTFVRRSTCPKISLTFQKDLKMRLFSFGSFDNPILGELQE